MVAKTAWAAALFSAVVLEVLLALPMTSAAQTSYRVKVHPDTEKLEAALERRGSLDARETPLRELIAQLKAQFQVPIMLAEKSVTDGGVNLDTPVTRQLHNMPLESILRLVLDNLELEFMVHEGVILISTPEEIESPDMIETRVYPVKDLVATRPTRRLGTSAGGSAEEVRLNFMELIDMIETTIAPESWDTVGGPGSISVFENAEAIVVSQSYRPHRHIEGLLETLRKVKGLQGIDSSASRSTASSRIKGRPVAPPERRFTTSSPASWQVPQVHRP
jgi:hypothetical protein